MFIQTENTPNPATLKFLPGRTVLPEGTLDLRNKEDADRSPLAAKLFEIPEISGVFFAQDFITVTKSDGEWQHLKPAILGAIMEHYLSGEPILKSGASSADFRRRGVFRRGRCLDRRHDQGIDRNAGATGGRQRRWRHHLPRL